MYKDESFKTSKLCNQTLNNTRKNIDLKAKNSSLELEKDFKPINISIDDINKFQEK